MRNVVWVSIRAFLIRITSVVLLFLTIGEASTRAEDDSSESQSHASEDGVFAWCLSHFLYAGELAGTTTLSMKDLAPLKLNEMIAPADLVTKTETVGRLPGYIRKYRGAWIWPSIAEPPPFAIFVERLTEKEMTIAFLSRATEANKDHRERLLENSREKLTWNGTAFSTEPEGELQSTTSIYISAFSDGLLLVRTNKREAWPMCFISSKRY